MPQTARIVGEVEYREGDGPNIPIRPGPVEVNTAATDVTLSWVDGDTHGAAAMPLTDFKRHVREGRIVMDNAQESSAPGAERPAGEKTQD